MKKGNKLFILGITISLILIIGIFIKININENYTPSTIPSNFIPNQIQTGILPTPIKERSIQVMYKPNIDYVYNDISKNTFMPGEENLYNRCFDSCYINPLCKGFVTDFTQNNTDTTKSYNCWLKDKMDTPTNKLNSNKRYSTIFPR